MLDNVNMNSVWGWWSQKKKKGRKNRKRKKKQQSTSYLKRYWTIKFSPFIAPNSVSQGISVLQDENWVKDHFYNCKLEHTELRHKNNLARMSVKNKMGMFLSPPKQIFTFYF